MARTAIDTDILLKGACYDLLGDLTAVIPASPDEVVVLGAAPYMAAKKLGRNAKCTDCEAAIGRMHEFLNALTILEPNDQELSLAAELEHMAQLRNVDLDAGESQLIAMVIVRELEWFATGDKRALVALRHLREEDDRIDRLDGKLICLEQLFLRLLNCHDPSIIRDKVCSEQQVDRTLCICFSCGNTSSILKHWIEGLESYITETKSLTAPLLAE